MVRIVSKDTEQETVGMVTELVGREFYITPFSFVEGLKTGDNVFLDQSGLTIPVGKALLGRVVDPFMRLKDGAFEELRRIEIPGEIFVLEECDFEEVVRKSMAMRVRLRGAAGELG